MPGHRIEVAKSGRSKCVTCDDVIPKGGVRLSEEYHDIGIPEPIHRFYHLKCAAAVHPELVASALAQVDEGVEFDRAEIEAKIAPAVQRAAEARKQKYLAQQAEKEAKVVVVATDETTNELLSQLDGNPEDPGTLAVVADQLQARGDIRGELIALQLGNASPAFSLEGDDDEETDASDLTSDADRRARRIAELMEKLSLPLDPGDRVVWGVGFVKRLELLKKSGTRLGALMPIFKHPTLRFLSEFKVTFATGQDPIGFVPQLGTLLPKSLRLLELGDSGHHPLTGTAAAIAPLPRLDTLLVHGKINEALAHPTLRILHASYDLDVINKLSPKHLPALEEIVLTPFETSLAVASAALGAKWFKKLACFGWHSTRELTADDVTAFASVLGKKKLKKLDLGGTKLSLALRDKLAALCGEIVAPDVFVAQGQQIFFEHTNKPEWGRGKLLRKHEGKVEVQFPKPIGLKVFKADAPFLKMIA